MAGPVNGLHHAMRHHRLIHVKLEMTLAAGDSDSRVVAEYLTADHCHCFTLCRIHFSGHDRGARFVLRKNEFAEAGSQRQREIPRAVLSASE